MNALACALVLAVVAGLPACSVTALAERERSIATNSCDTSSDCAGGSSCLDGTCVAGQGTLSTLLFEVSPTLSTVELAGEKLYQLANDVPRASGNYSLEIAGVADVTGLVRANLPEGCDVSFVSAPDMAALPTSLDDSIPARFTFMPRERTWGVSVSNLTAMAKPAYTSGSGLPDEYSFEAQLAAGSYDIYIEPYDVMSTSAEPSGANCALPPLLIFGTEIERGMTQLELSMPQPSHLDLSVRWPEGTDTLDGWVIDMLDPTSGRVISTRPKLTLPTTTDGVRTYSLHLDYLTATNADTSHHDEELVRLAPPNGVVAPTLLFELSALGLFTKGVAVIDQLTQLPRSVSLSGRVVDADGGNAIAASLVLIASSIDGLPAGTLASFVRNVQTDDSGQFHVDLLPGSYRVQATPLAPSRASDVSFSASESMIVVAASPAQQAGRAIPIARAQTVAGSVLVPDGDAGALGAQVTVEPNPATISTSVFERALGELPLVPRSASTTVADPSGAFALFADAAHYDLSVRPPAASNFAWLVVPGLDLSTPTDSLSLRLPPPVRVQLDVRLPENEDASILAGSHVRAYALLDENGSPVSDAEQAKSAVPVAESTLDDRASASLWLPATVNTASP